MKSLQPGRDAEDVAREGAEDPLSRHSCMAAINQSCPALSTSLEFPMAEALPYRPKMSLLLCTLLVCSLPSINHHFSGPFVTLGLSPRNWLLSAWGLRLYRSHSCLAQCASPHGKFCQLRLSTKDAFQVTDGCGSGPAFRQPPSRNHGFSSKASSDAMQRAICYKCFKCCAACSSMPIWLLDAVP